jgi:hypothetical protein
MWTALLLATFCFVSELLARDTLRLNSPFDQLAESPERAWRFIWLVTGFVVMCLTALPILLVGSQALVLLQLVGAELVDGRWAN